MRKTILGNGFTIISEENKYSKSVNLGISTKAGSYHEKGFPNGIAHFIEHMLFKGTESKTSKEMNRIIDSIGGVWNAYTDHEETKYHATVSKDFWKVGAELLLDMIWNHTLPIEEIEKERNVILEEIKMYKDDLQSLVFDLLISELHKNQEERKSIIGTEESVNSIQREDMIRFIDTFYQPDNMFLIATGNVNHEELVEYVKNFGFTRDKETSVQKTAYKVSDGKFNDLTVRKDTQQAHMAWAVRTEGIKSSDMIPLQVICDILGGSSSSRLFESVREDKGLCYSIFTDQMIHSDVGYVIGYVGTEEDKIEEVKNQVIQEFESLKNEKLEVEELQRYINYTKGIFTLKIEGNGQVNNFISQNLVLDVDFDAGEIIKGIENVTPDDVQRVAKKYFNKEEFVFCKILPN